MEINDIGILSLEASASLLVMVICYKILKMRIRTHSGCCGDKLEIDTENPGAENTPMDTIVAKI